MRKLTASLASAAVAFAALTSFAPAHAVPTNNAPAPSAVELVRLLNGEIATADCGRLGTTLRVTGMANRETTRSQLVANVNNAVGQNAPLRLVAAPTVNALGDRAVECGVVKPDPATPMTQFLQMSSKLSSDAGLPDLRTIAPTLAG
ncbi:hypothetical protein V6D40_06155 [Corynebacterium sp. Q4381]|uniref:hypothetical protein n=1 Tax=Corynebacterium sp. Marseille-Q4381 TaxID=3121597 RepID=UPI002FE5BE96